MILLAALALSTAVELDALDRAVETCAREAVNPAFASEARRRSGFMTTVVRDQEQIVAARTDLADRRRALRETGAASVKSGDNEAALSLSALALEDRQRALNDRRMLEGLRGEAMDAKRRYFLAHCAPTKDAK